MPIAYVKNIFCTDSNIACWDKVVIFVLCDSVSNTGLI